MLGLLLGGLIGRAAAGAAAGAAARAASRPILGGLMARRGGGGSMSGGGISGTSSPGSSEQATTIKAQPPEQTPQQPPERPEAPSQPQVTPMVQEMSAGLQQRPTLQEQKPQPSNPTTPVKPLEGLLDTPAAPAPPQPVAGTKVDAPQPVVSQDKGPQPIAKPIEETFPNSPAIAQPFLANRTGQPPPRTTFIAPDGNPSKPLDTSTKVNNASPGYSTLGMTTPSAAAPQFSYLRR